MTDDDLPIDLREQLRGALGAVEPPDEFARRVVAAGPAYASPPTPARRPRVAAAIIGAAGAAIAVIAVTIAMGASVRRHRAPAAAGHLVAADRSQLSLGDRAIAVADAGAELSWSVAPGGAGRVQQAAGAVFYRVESGGPFVVATPAGEVTVLGTCFRVEVNMGPKTRIGMAALSGAVAAAGLVVIVYEGRVRVQNAHGATEVGAGERAEVAAGGAPVAVREPPTPPADPTAVAAAAAARDPLDAPPPATATREELIARDAAQRARVAALGDEVARVTHDRDALRSQAAAAAEAPAEPEYFNLSPEDWRSMAAKCEVRYVMPPLELDVDPLPPERASALGLSDDEAVAVRALLRSSVERHLAALRALYIEATGDTEGADTLDPSMLWVEILSKAGGGDVARRRIAEEHAGVVPPRPDPAAAPIAERYYRLVLDTSYGFEQGLAQTIGHQRARALIFDLQGAREVSNGCD